MMIRLTKGGGANLVTCVLFLDLLSLPAMNNPPTDNNDEDDEDAGRIDDSVHSEVRG